MTTKSNFIQYLHTLLIFSIDMYRNKCISFLQYKVFYLLNQHFELSRNFLMHFPDKHAKFMLACLSVSEISNTNVSN